MRIAPAAPTTATAELDLLQQIAVVDRPRASTGDARRPEQPERPAMAQVSARP
jgi:hypothetical protein